MRIAVIGAGYVGLVASACFADNGNQVVCVDSDSAKVDLLAEGRCPIYEPGLEELLSRNLRAGRLQFATSLSPAIERAEIVFLAVGTPSAEDGQADLTQLLSVADEIAPLLRPDTLVVNKSTVPPGTAGRLGERITRKAGFPVEVVANPEFLKEGAAVDDFLKPDRVILGTRSARARESLADVYAPFTRRNDRILHLDPRSAELAKYASNAMLATRVSFMNEMAALCEKVGADIEQVRVAIGTDSRIGLSFLFPGAGMGGSCIPKDLRALEATAREHGLEIPLTSAVRAVNEKQKTMLLEKALQVFDGDLAGRHFAVWGLSFKPRTDDMREAPSIPLVEGLLQRGARVAVHDPAALRNARQIFGDRVLYAEDPYMAAEGADALFVVTEWNEYRRPHFERLRATMKAPVLFDGRNLYPPARMKEQGFVYRGIGRG